MKKQGAFDLFGKALLAYAKGDRNKFYFEDVVGHRFEQPIAPFFSKMKPFTKLEREIISLSRGRILDVGCGSGGFLSSLRKKGDVLGIDNSPSMIQICRKRGLKNVKVADIFRFKMHQKFDTICLLDENMGIAENVDGVKKLLVALSNLLNQKGYILANAEEIRGNYSKWKARCVWKGKKGPYFNWIKINSSFLRRICRLLHLNCRVILRDNKRYVVKISHSTK